MLPLTTKKNKKTKTKTKRKTLKAILWSPGTDLGRQESTATYSAYSWLSENKEDHIQQAETLLQAQHAAEPTKIDTTNKPARRPSKSMMKIVTKRINHMSSISASKLTLQICRTRPEHATSCKLMPPMRLPSRLSYWKTIPAATSRHLRCRGAL